MSPRSPLLFTLTTLITIIQDSFERPSYSSLRRKRNESRLEKKKLHLLRVGLTYRKSCTKDAWQFACGEKLGREILSNGHFILFYLENLIPSKFSLKCIELTPNFANCREILPLHFIILTELFV